MTDMIYFSTCNSQLPRIVAAKLKRQLKGRIGFNDCTGKPRISGDLRIVDRSFRHLRYAEVRDGCLIIYRYVGHSKVWDLRIPLYNLNINLDSPKHYCQFSLSRFGEIAPIATFQVVKEQTYKKWLKVLAVEVIKQTPLNTLKFLDILFIEELLEKSPEKCRHTGRLSRQILDDSYPAHPYDSSHDVLNDSHEHKPNYGVDSGYCSLQSANGKLEESDTENKTFDQLCKKFQHEASTHNTKKYRTIREPLTKSINIVSDKENLPEITLKDYHNFSSKIHSKIEYYQNFQPQKRISHLKQISANHIEPPDTHLTIPDVLKDLPDTLPRTKHKPKVRFQLPQKVLHNDADTLVRLITKCQIDKEYVPVREKRMLFESLSRFSFSVDNLRKRFKSEIVNNDGLIKSNSFSSLPNSPVQVSAMKEFFEQINDKK